MSEKKIVIISKSRELSRFFELEAERFGFAVTVCDSSVEDLSGFDMALIDLDGLHKMPTLLSKRVVLISDSDLSDTSDSAAVKRIAYPVSLDTLDGIYRELAYGDIELTVARSENASDKIYFYRSYENTVRYKERNIQLSDHEMKILERLCSNACEPVSREELNLLLGAQKGNISDVYICRLRQKLEADDGKRIIFTVRSKGYKIITDMEWE